MKLNLKNTGTSAYNKKYSKITSKIRKFREILSSSPKSFFIDLCKKLLSKKLYSLGLLENISKLDKEIISINTFKKRRIKWILVNDNFTKSIEASLEIIRDGRVYLNGNIVTNPNSLVGKGDEITVKLTKRPNNIYF